VKVRISKFWVLLFINIFLLAQSYHIHRKMATRIKFLIDKIEDISLYVQRWYNKTLYTHRIERKSSHFPWFFIMLVNTKHVYVHNMGWGTISCFYQKGQSCNTIHIQFVGRLQVQHNQGERLEFRLHFLVRKGIRRTQHKCLPKTFSVILLLLERPPAQLSTVHRENEIKKKFKHRIKSLTLHTAHRLHFRVFIKY
jgi:hypothetical protein